MIGYLALRKRVVKDQDVIKQIFSIALPTFIGFIGIILFEATDLFWISKIESKAVSALGAASFLEWMLYTLMLTSNIGCTALVARFIGAKDSKNIQVVIKESFQIVFILAFLFMLLFISKKTFQRLQQ